MNKKPILKAILRQNLSSFIYKTFTTINPGAKYIANWHIDLIADYLERVKCGKIKRLIINLPPRSLKSICISVAFPAWILGNDPTKRIIVASYSQTLSTKHSLDCRFIMNSKWYQKTFLDTKLSSSHNQKNKFITTKYGFRFATSVGGSITGEGGNFLILDDPHNPTHIHSDKMRSKTIEWFENSFISRLNNQEEGAVIIVMQRLHDSDLCGYLDKKINNNYNWNILKIPAIANNVYTFKFNSGKEILLKKGQILSVRYNKRILENIMNEVGQNNFAAQYLQEPISQKTSMIPKDCIQIKNSMQHNFIHYIISIDSAIKTSENADYSVCTVWGIKVDEYHLIDMLRDKISYPELKYSIKNIINKYNPDKILIEDKASGQSLIQDLRSEGIVKIVAQKPKFDKVTRFASVIDVIESGYLVVYNNLNFTHIFLDEINTFPYSKHDDIVDSLSQFLHYMKNHKRRNIKIRSVD